MFQTKLLSKTSSKVIDVFDSDIPKNDFISVSSNITGVSGSRLDVHKWLPHAAPHYQISPNLNDYIIVPVVTVVSEIPNTNGDFIEREEIMEFNTQFGMCFYNTFKGKPVQHEHNNKVLSQARGVILDCYVSPLKGFAGNRIKIVQLLAIDKTKDREIANDIANRKINTYSIGAKYQAYQCSISKKIYRPNQQAGQYTQPNVPTYRLNNGQLVFRKLKDLYGFETSIVKNPAFISALSDDIIDMSSAKFDFI